MELQAARQIIDTLAQGVNPVTGEVYPEDAPYNAPPVIRALFAVSSALDKVAPVVQPSVVDIHEAMIDAGLAHETMRKVYAACTDPVLLVVYEVLMVDAGELARRVEQIATAVKAKEDGHAD